MSPQHTAVSRGPMSSERARQAALVVTRGISSRPARAIERGMFTLGRSAECDLVLNDAQFALFYAYILRLDGNFVLQRLVGEPILTINGVPIRRAMLQDGDRIRCGPYELVFQRSGGLEASTNPRPANPDADRWRAWEVCERIDPTEAAVAKKLIADIRNQLRPTETIQRRRSA